MAEPKTPKAKKGKKTKPWVYVAVVGAAGVVYYLYKQHAANSAASSSTPTSGIDPATGQPYAAGVGSLAGGGSSTTPTDPLQAIDPATGQTYAAELAGTAAATQQTQADVTGLQGVLATLTGDLQAILEGQQPPGTSSPSPGHGGANAGLNTWRTKAAAIIAKAEGISTAQAGQAISQYLQGKPITNAAAARGLSNVIRNGNTPPTATGHVPPVRVARPKAAAPRKVVTTKVPHRPTVTRRPTPPNQRKPTNVIPIGVRAPKRP